MERQYPLLTDRIQSTFIDTLFLIILTIIASAVTERYEHMPDWARIGLFVGIWVLYEPLATTLGFTIGNYIKGLRVRRITDASKRINFFQALGRYAIKVALGWISFLTIHGNPNRQAIHDMAVGSVVIKA